MEVALPFLGFPVMFAVIWVGVTWLLGWMSGWHALMERYPDRHEQPALDLSWQTGAMGVGVNYKNVLKLAVCPSGLRIGVMKLFGPFARDFLVPWRDLKVKRSRWFWTDVAELAFGAHGKLVVTAAVADQLAAAAGKNWPEGKKRR
ncbi:MAG: hypothetical protein KBA31_18070 [Alphaproteobacteria bacterium]|nr:hypothetical protein [Alphaproteobacteria bacterium]